MKAFDGYDADAGSVCVCVCLCVPYRTLVRGGFMNTSCASQQEVTRSCYTAMKHDKVVTLRPNSPDTPKFTVLLWLIGSFPRRWSLIEGIWI